MALRQFTGEIRRFTEQPDTPYAMALLDAVERLEGTSRWLQERAVGHPHETGAASVEYLHLFGYTAYAWMWARMAAVAQARRIEDEALRLPEDAEALESLINDIRRMKEHFGSHYALIVNKNMKPFLRMLQDVSGETVWAKEVDYTEDVTHWDVSCKSQVYAYQREFRFGFGECGVSETEPYVFDHPDGFAHHTDPQEPGAHH